MASHEMKHVPAGFMSMSPRARLEALAMSKKIMPAGEYEAWKSEVTEAARELRAAGARPVGSVPTRRLAPHEERSIQRSARAIAKAHAAGRPGAQTLLEVAAQNPRTAAPAHPNNPEYLQIMRASGVRPQERHRPGYSDGGRF